MTPNPVVSTQKVPSTTSFDSIKWDGRGIQFRETKYTFLFKRPLPFLLGGNKRERFHLEPILVPIWEMHEAVSRKIQSIGISWNRASGPASERRIKKT